MVVHNGTQAKTKRDKNPIISPMIIQKGAPLGAMEAEDTS